ncbi:MAG: WhiB family transcriptional regulator [Corynebacteriales bacterium]|nr:WhiB family transcriptional regulator [Mycobacteriales bacterium]
MTRARMPRPHEVQAAARDPRFLRAQAARPDLSWRTQARCRTVDPETFFPLPTEPADLALALCNACPVAAECLRAALEAGDCEGVWGGTTPRERRAMLAAWRADEDSPLPVGTPTLVAPSLRGSRRGSTRTPIHAKRDENKRETADVLGELLAGSLRS